MIIVMQKQASSEAVARVIELIRGRGLQEHISQGEERTIIGAVGDERVLHPHEIESLPEVERAIRVLNAWRIVSREAQPQNSVITVRGVAFGAEKMLDITTLPERAAAADAFFADPFYLPYSPYAAAYKFIKQFIETNPENESFGEEGINLFDELEETVKDIGRELLKNERKAKLAKETNK